MYLGCYKMLTWYIVFKILSVWRNIGNGNLKYSANYFSMQFSTILKDWNVLFCVSVGKNNVLFIIWYSINAVNFI